MAEPNIISDGPIPRQNDDTAFQACHDYRWDLDKDFLVSRHLSMHSASIASKLTLLLGSTDAGLLQGGLVLALGGYHALARTASQADIIMHSRLFYYARVSGVSIPYAAYRQWLRNHLLHAQQPPRIWEWDLLEALCSHRDRLAASSHPPQPPLPSSSSSPSLPPPPPGPLDQAAVAAEKDLWTRELLGGGGEGTQSAVSPNGGGTRDSTAPAWMTAAPRAQLYVDRAANATNRAADNDNDDDDEDDVGSGQVPYPERFAAIIKAVQSGEPIEGIVEIPDIVARNPVSSRRPFLSRIWRFFLCHIRTEPGFPYCNSERITTNFF